MKTFLWTPHKNTVALSVEYLLFPWEYLLLHKTARVYIIYTSLIIPIV